MANIGKQTIKFKKNISILETASIVGPKEGDGPLKNYFDIVLEDIMAGENTWEKAESIIVRKSLELATKKAKLAMTDIDYIIAGDLLNQNTGSTFGIRDLHRPFIGIFSACSAMGLSMGLGATFLESNFAKNVLASSSSHFCAAEKQFRFPLELGSQRPPTSTTTVTGCGVALLSNDNSDLPKIKAITTGKIVDMGITDPFNMGAAMAPAALDTIITHFNDLNIEPDYYDLIITGDLGHIGSEIILTLSKKEGYLLKNYKDCGILIYDKDTQDTHSGGSGCACAGTTFAGYLYKKMIEKEIKKLLFVPTGALLSPLSVLQKESIPGIAHAVAIEI
ncbi:MAG: stage V sporulation protein AD [Defluviitaleaceae bacterium]|nr:stage V sporulation protein AD [Defluviitaleaceae bacterium]